MLGAASAAAFERALEHALRVRVEGTCRRGGDMPAWRGVPCRRALAWQPPRAHAFVLGALTIERQRER
jgi:hypothetical protein